MKVRVAGKEPEGWVVKSKTGEVDRAKMRHSLSISDISPYAKGSHWGFSAQGWPDLLYVYRSGEWLTGDASMKAVLEVRAVGAPRWWQVRC